MNEQEPKGFNQPNKFQPNLPLHHEQFQQNQPRMVHHPQDQQNQFQQNQLKNQG